MQKNVRPIDDNALINKKNALFEIKQLAKEIARENGGVDDITMALKEAYDRIADAPVIDAVEVVHGRWEEIRNAYGEIEGWLCKCGREDKVKEKYCPSCGAKMDGGLKR